MKFTSPWKISDPLAQYIIYLRKSRKDMEAEALGQTDTLKRHRAALLSLSESRELNVVEICEEVVTGDSIAVRPTDNTNKFNVIGAKIDAQTQMINDKFCQLEMREMQNKIDTLRAEKSALELGLSQSAQTANIVNQLRPCPVPAYLTCNPFGCNGGFTGYGYGYNDGCGCGC